MTRGAPTTTAPVAAAGAAQVAPSVVIELAGIAKTYPGPPPVPALRPAWLTVARGDYVTVVGPSGSGKSTLLNVIGLLDRPTAGTYLLDGMDTAAMSDRERTALRGQRIGFVFQAFHLLGGRTAVENVALAMLYTDVPRRERTGRALEALDRVGLSARASAPAAQLSGGEKQRVAIARALVNRPSLLLCDEPTGSLDSANGEGVLALIDDLHADGITVAVITHDAKVADRGERVIAVSDGQLREVGR